MEFYLGQYATAPAKSKKIQRGYEIRSPSEFSILPKRTHMLNTHITFIHNKNEHIYLEICDKYKGKLFIINSYYRSVNNQSMIIELQNTSDETINLNKNDIVCDIVKQLNIISNVVYLSDINEKKRQEELIEKKRQDVIVEKERQEKLADIKRQEMAAAANRRQVELAVQNEERQRQLIIEEAELETKRVEAAAALLEEQKQVEEDAGIELIDDGVDELEEDEEEVEEEVEEESKDEVIPQVKPKRKYKKRTPKPIVT